MSGNWTEGHGRSRNAIAGIWALLLVYVLAIIWEGNTGDPLAATVRDATFGLLLAGFGVSLLHQYGTAETLGAAASSLFVLSGLVQVAAAVAPVPLVIVGFANLAIFVAVVLYAVYWIQNRR